MYYVKRKEKAKADLRMGIPGSMSPGMIIWFPSLRTLHSKRELKAERFTSKPLFAESVECVANQSDITSEPVIRTYQWTKIDLAHILESLALPWGDHWECHCSGMRKCRWLNNSLVIIVITPTKMGLLPRSTGASGIRISFTRATRHSL